jgi:hypothetical protein
MAKPKKLKITALHFHNALEVLKEVEKTNSDIRINNVPLSKYLLEVSDAVESLNSISDQVKVAILITHGVNNPDPSELSDETKMSDFSFSDMQYIKLTRRFNKIAQQTNAEADISVSDVQNCETVKECIDLVAKAATP